MSAALQLPLSPAIWPLLGDTHRARYGSRADVAIRRMEFKSEAVPVVLLCARNPHVVHDLNSIKIDFGASEISRWGVCLPMGKLTFRYFSALLVNHGRLVSHEDLWEAIWGDDEDGGPDAPKNWLQVVKCRFRRRLASIGVCIIARHWAQEVAILSRPERLS